jgi:amidophosphoribosyltransferase
MVASAAPPVRYPNVYGIDMPTRAELIAHLRGDDEIRREIGADALIYQRVDDLKQAVRDCNPRLTNFEASCFDGAYITGDVTPAYLDQVERAREQPAAAADDGGRSQLSLAIETAD